MNSAFSQWFTLGRKLECWLCNHSKYFSVKKDLHIIELKNTYFSFEFIMFNDLMMTHWLCYACNPSRTLLVYVMISTWTLSIILTKIFSERNLLATCKHGFILIPVVDQKQRVYHFIFYHFVWYTWWYKLKLKKLIVDIKLYM